MHAKAFTFTQPCKTRRTVIVPRNTHAFTHAHTDQLYVRSPSQTSTHQFVSLVSVSDEEIQNTCRCTIVHTSARQTIGSIYIRRLAIAVACCWSTSIEPIRNRRTHTLIAHEHQYAQCTYQMIAYRWMQLQALNAKTDKIRMWICSGLIVSASFTDESSNYFWFVPVPTKRHKNRQVKWKDKLSSQFSWTTSSWATCLWVAFCCISTEFCCIL